MKIYEFMKDKRYINIVNEFIKGYERTAKQRDREVKHERIQSDVREFKVDILSKMKEYHSTRESEIQAKLSQIEKDYTQQSKYDNPQEEVLRRQDFDMKLQMSSNHELVDLMEEDLNEYEYNKLYLTMKERDMSEASQVKVNKSRSFQSEHVNDPNYQALHNELQYLRLIKPSANSVMFYLPESEEYALSVPLNRLDEIASLSKFKTDRTELKQLQQAYDVLKQYESFTIQSEKELQKTHINNKVEHYKKHGLPKQYEYDNADKRAIKGTDEYEVEHEFKYLKERYHDNDNYTYNIDNPNYSITDHIEYLRVRHQQELKHNKELASKINDVLKEGKATEEKAV